MKFHLLLCLLEKLKSLSVSSNFIERATPNGRCTVRVHILKLPDALTKLLDESSDLLEAIIAGKAIQVKTMGGQDDDHPVEALRKRIWDAIESEVSDENAEKNKTLWENLLKRIWALGPRQVGPNMLLLPDSTTKETGSSVLIRSSPYVSERLGFTEASNFDEVEIENQSLIEEAKSLRSSVLSGFQVATAAGPLCDEPMWGLAFMIEASILPFESETEAIHQQSQSDQYGVFSGQVMTAVKEACKAALLQKNPRIVEGMYFCELNTPTEYLGPMYAVLARRRARILKEEMQEGSPLFTVHAYVPVAESFGFADELRRWTSGASSALLVLSHWEAVPEDPFFVPKTEEEKEEFGDGSSVLQNTARKLIDGVRRRKGLPVEEKVVQYATKQRTLARKV